MRGAFRIRFYRGAMFRYIKKIILKIFFSNRNNELYYINGPELLPPPLSADEEAVIISEMQSEPEKASVLIEHNLRLVVYIAKKFENTGVGIEDLVSIGTIGLIKAINSYKSDKNIKLATYASRCIENEILMYIRKSSNRHIEISIDEPLNTDWDGNELLLSDILGTEEDEVYRNIEEKEDKKIIADAVSKLNKREQLIVNMRFGLNGYKEKTQKEVADELGISQSYISRLEKKIMKRLKKEIETKI
ncbi:MAG: RNA polymerase sporulation sigma factor SigE [Clostridia bacterium]|nr:RNA polymerase sporulation sigma factor SigE [Clostridia bacterium]